MSDRSFTKSLVEKYAITPKSSSSPVVDAKPSTADHVQRIINNYENNGWWSNLFEASKVKYAERQAKKAEHLLALQRTANEAEAVAYLRAHNLWTLEIEAVLKAEEAKTRLMAQHHVRTSMQHEMVRQEFAMREGLSVVANETVIVAKKQSDIKVSERLQETYIAFNDHKQREELKADLDIRVYSEKNDALTKHALLEDTIRAERVAGLEKLYIDRHNLQKSYVLPEDEPLKHSRLELLQKEISRLEAELHGMGRDSQSARTKDYGEDDGGSTPPAQSGFPPKAQSQNSPKPPSSSGLGHVN
jgi:hypothetical protein